jgi:hypothetical protein
LAQGSPKYDYGDIHSAHAGERLPIPVIPAGTSYKPGDESVYAGRGSFYVLNYGPYTIAMNMTKDKTFTFHPQKGAPHLRDLVTGKAVSGMSSIEVPPMSTKVICDNHAG